MSFAAPFSELSGFEEMQTCVDRVRHLLVGLRPVGTRVEQSLLDARTEVTEGRGGDRLHRFEEELRRRKQGVAVVALPPFNEQQAAEEEKPDGDSGENRREVGACVALEDAPWLVQRPGSS